MLEIIMLPCNYIHIEFNKTATSDTIAKECIANLTAQQEYMGSLELVFYANQDRFDPKGFYDDAIIHESVITTT